MLEFVYFFAVVNVAVVVVDDVVVDDVVVAVVCVVCFSVCRWRWDEFLLYPFCVPFVVFRPLEFPVVDPVFCDLLQKQKIGSTRRLFRKSTCQWINMFFLAKS